VNIREGGLLGQVAPARRGSRRWSALPGLLMILAIIAVLLSGVLSALKTTDYIETPAPAEAIDTHVTVAGHPPRPGRGSLYITFIYQQQASVLSKFWNQHFNPNASVYSSLQLFGPVTPPTQQQQQQTSAIDMIGSKNTASIAAFSALGYHALVKVKTAVGFIAPSSKANGLLQVQDIIVSLDGRAVADPASLHAVEEGLKLKPGAVVTVVIKRGDPTGAGGTTMTFHIPTIALKGRAILGIDLAEAYTPYHLPYKVSIDSGDIGGPSAGLMFALSIYNRLSPVDITHGHKIAGTGTIAVNGVVGPIGGVHQKIIGAAESGAQYFFVPAYCHPEEHAIGDCNKEEAKPYPPSITVVPVNTLQEALTYLKRLK